MPYQNYKISLCTVSMNRLFHLRNTLPVNIKDNPYPNLEYVILDYNSTDGLEKYIKSSFEDLIASGLLVYYRTQTPHYFNRSHSRNLLFKLATGDIICNVDADNFCGKNYAEYVSMEFNKNEGIFLTTISGNDGIILKRDTLGKICVKKKDFYIIRGYDEKMQNYGYEDFDFANRLELSGLKRKSIDLQQDFFNAISHTHKDRLANEFVINKLYAVFIRHITPSSSDIIYLFKNWSFYRGVLINNATFDHTEPISNLRKAQLKYEYSIASDFWEIGKWKSAENKIVLTSEGEEEELIRNINGKCLSSISQGKTLNYHKIINPSLLELSILNFSEISNRIIMEYNKINKYIIVNENNFGKDIVYKNFNHNNPIEI